jgi:hypothetical protein
MSKPLTSFRTTPLLKLPLLFRPPLLKLPPFQFKRQSLTLRQSFSS